MSGNDNFNAWLSAFFEENRLPESQKKQFRFVSFDQYACFDNSGEDFIVFEDQWIKNPNDIKSKIISELGLSRRIFARNCQTEEISRRIAREFASRHHIYGYARSKVHLGLHCKDELAALATFAEPRQFPSGLSAEMTRFCNKSFTTVVGGLSKLIKAYVRLYNPDDIMTYADLDRGSGSALRKIGFRPEEEKSGIVFLCNKDTGERIPEKHFSNYENRNRYVPLKNAGSIKYVLRLTSGTN
jgi:hypothetical protein